MRRRREWACPGCGFNVRKAVIAIICPDEGTQSDGRVAYCSVACADKKGATLGPHQRAMLLRAEAAANDS